MANRPRYAAAAQGPTQLDGSAVDGLTGKLAVVNFTPEAAINEAVQRSL